MCLIIHKPKHRSVPSALLLAAAQHNRDGIGVVACTGTQRVDVWKYPGGGVDDLIQKLPSLNEQECVIHFRKCTAGRIHRENTHPFAITRHLYLVHNGTLRIDLRQRGKSDTWHFVTDYLRPLLRADHDRLHDPGFQRFLSEWVGPDNKLVVVDALRHKSVFVNRERGLEYQGLWLSNDRGLDRLGIRSDGVNAVIPAAPSASLRPAEIGAPAWA